jgi:transcriptional regulator with XRE-family HTH domain
MLTALGKELRKLRLENGELLKDMAEKLNISASYLSSIENGKKTPVRGFVDEIVSLYGLSENQASTLEDSYYTTINEISIKINDTNNEKMNLGLVFARKINNLDSDQIKNIFDILGKGDK